MKIEARPWTPQDLIDDLQDIINEESNEYGVHKRTVMDAVSGKNWSGITIPEPPEGR